MTWSVSEWITGGVDASTAESWRREAEQWDAAGVDREEQWRRITRRWLSADVPFAAHAAIWRDVFRNRPADAGPPPAWLPEPADIEQSNLAEVARLAGLSSVEQVHAWSVAHREEFWRLVIERLDVPFQTPYQRILSGEDAESPRWLPGGRWNIADSCLQAAAEKTAIVFQREGGGLERVSYGELDLAARSFASGLRRLGAEPGRAIGIMAPLTPQSVAAFLGCILAGCAPVAIAESFAEQEIATRLRIADADWLITQDELVRDGKRLPCSAKAAAVPGLRRMILLHGGQAPALASDPRAVLYQDLLQGGGAFQSVAADADTDSTILFSSGTTGEPKAIPWNHATPLKCAADAWLHHDIRESSVLCWPTSLGWMMGPWLIYAGLMHRATLALFDGSPKSGEFVRFVQRSGVTMLGVVPSLVRAWRKSDAVPGDAWRGVRTFSSTGECSWAEDMLYLMSRAGYRPVIEYCGGTEIGGGYISGVVTRPCSPATFNSPAAGLDFVVLAEDDCESLAGRDADQQAEEGEAFLIPPSIGLSQRLKNADHHAVYFEDCPTWRGRVLRRHGDRIQRLPQGYYRVGGRADDTMNLGGIKVSSAELERCLIGAEGVREVAAVAVAAGEGGPADLVVFVVGEGESPAEELRSLLQHRVNRYLNPLFRIRRVLLTDSMPRTASNKIMRRVLRERAAAVLREDR